MQPVDVRERESRRLDYASPPAPPPGRPRSAVVVLAVVMAACALSALSVVLLLHVAGDEPFWGNVPRSEFWLIVYGSMVLAALWLAWAVSVIGLVVRRKLHPAFLCGLLLVPLGIYCTFDARTAFLDDRAAWHGMPMKDWPGEFTP